MTIKIPILMYHSIELMPSSTIMRSLHVPKSRFSFQMKILSMLGYKGLSMSELTPYLEGKKEGKVVGITFDDGYQNNLVNAAPILKKYNFSATCYLVSQKIGLSNVWDKPNGITQRPLMNKREIQKWINMGMEIGAHTLTHSDLTSIDSNQIEKEINDSKAQLENLFKISITNFCYPYGRFNKEVLDFVKSAGFNTATTMVRGRAQLGENKFELPRIPITHHTLPHLFLAKILTSYEDRRKSK